MRSKMNATLLVALVAGTLAFTAEGSKDQPRKSHGVLPAGVRGFSGQVRGTVVTKAEGTFQLKVAEILKTWKNNKAENPKDLAGRTVRVTPRCQKADSGQLKANAFHLAFIRKLEVGQEHVLELIHEEGNQFMLLELSKEQRKMAGVPKR